MCWIRQEVHAAQCQGLAGIWDEEHNGNNLGVNLPHFGVSKLKKLVDQGMTTGLQVPEMAMCNDRFVKLRWTKTVESHPKWLPPHPE